MLVLVRGLPGSGKSTVGKRWQAAGFVHLEADQFLLTQTGEYLWTPTRLRIAHERCQDETRVALAGRKDVIVSNSFVRKWEISPYMEMAKRSGTSLVVIKATGAFKSVHDVPEEVLARMAAIWEDFPNELLPDEIEPPEKKGAVQLALI